MNPDSAVNQNELDRHPLAAPRIDICSEHKPIDFAAEALRLALSVHRNRGIRDERGE